MPPHTDPRRDAARRLFERIEQALAADETLSDKDILRLMLRKAEEQQKAQARKRFDAIETLRQRFIYPVIDECIGEWLRQREIRADPFSCFRYKGPERGPTQHETAVGPAVNTIRHYFDRITTAAPGLAGHGAAVLKNPNQAPAPDFRFQPPLPFGAAGDCLYTDDRDELARALHRAAMYVAVGGDVSRGWRYDCALVVCCASARPRLVLGDDLFDQWPEIRDALWQAVRVWVIVV